MDKKNSHFVLVHGSCHGAWCWYKVATLLSSHGHRVIATDLGASGINPKQLDDIPTISGYLQPLMEFLAALPLDEKVVLVGHSMGGVAISVAMEKFPEKVAVGVYASAIMPDPDFNLLTLNQQRIDNIYTANEEGKVTEESEPPSQYLGPLDVYADSKFTFELGRNNPATSILFGPKFLSSMLYQLSPPEDLTLALALERPFPIYRDGISLKEASLSKKYYGSVPRAFILCSNDLILTDEAARSIIQNYPPDVVKVINGADHMVMFSKPQDLCSSLEQIAEKYH
ncbi:hypothetical protein LguiA_022467 [Lonicera macranthoides]